jgi:hypothetical protein
VVVLQSALWLTLISVVSIPLIHQANVHERLRPAEGNSCSLESLYVSFLGTANLLVAAALAALVTYAARYVWARSPVLTLERRARWMPRMLFGPLITTAIILTGALQVLVFALVYVNDVISNQFMSSFAQGLGNVVVGWLPWQVDVEGWFAYLQKEKLTYYSIVAGVAALVSGLAMLGGASAIHVTRDLLNHQYSPKLGYSFYLLPHFLYPRREGKNMDRPRRARIAARLDTLARDVICPAPGFTDLLFVAHSQGSVIVYDYARRGGPDCERLLCTRPHFITFGSPLGHLYQHYFKEYSELGKGIAGLRSTFASWTNLYRVDDWVGRRINDGEGFVDNVVLPPGGHVGYWRTPDLAQLILDRIRTPAATCV